MEISITGQCMCGAISYVCAAEPKFSFLCQCTQCQKITGSGHSAQFAVDATKTEIRGTVKKFSLASDAGNIIESAFCPDCGNPIYKTTTLMPDTLVFHASTLDEPATFKPDFLAYSGSGQSWDHIDPAIERKG